MWMKMYAGLQRKQFVETWIKSHVITTSKTTVAQEIIKKLKDKNPNLQVCVAAPTHKAVENIERKTKNIADKSMTLAALFGLKEKQTVDGETYFEKDKYSKNSANDYNLIVVDECSMITEDLLAYVKETDPDVSFIFLGDVRQALPIRKDEYGNAVDANSPTFTDDCETITLTELCRQAGENPIGDFVHTVAAEAIKDKPNINEVNALVATSKDSINNNGALIFKNAINEMALESFAEAKKKKNPFHVKIVAARNATVAAYNKKIHDYLFPDAPNSFVPGESVIVTRSEVIDNQVKTANSLEFNIESIKESGDIAGIKVYPVTGTDPISGKKINCETLLPDGAKAFAQLGKLVFQEGRTDLKPA